MFITDKTQLEAFTTKNRIWQGIPSIEVTKGGRIFSTFYSGGTREEIDNYSMVVYSDDGGKTFTEPIVVTFKKDHRCFDPCLWIDPLGKLWFTWALNPAPNVYASVCDDPDADELIWSEPFPIGGEVMMNKPTVLSTGEWLFPITFWHKSMLGLSKAPIKNDGVDRLAYAYKTVDNGKTFTRLGGVNAPNRSFDEHVIFERCDGSLAMYIRTHYGIAVSYSYDKGNTWCDATDSGLGGPSARFAIRRLRSGRMLLINHVNFKGRSNLTALLSEDDGATFKYSFLLDGRNDVSYPDFKEADDGYIYITYDRERGGFWKSLAEAEACAREILFAKITEDDIMAGKLVSEGSSLCNIINKLGKYEGENKNPYSDIKLYSDGELLESTKGKSTDEFLAVLFDTYPVLCVSMHKLERDRLTALADSLASSPDDEALKLDIIKLIRSVSATENAEIPIVENVKKLVETDLLAELSISAIAEKLGVNKYYMCHLFKKTTKLTIMEYRHVIRMSYAKRQLVGTDKKITEIAQSLGFSDSSYFSKVFMDAEGLSPTYYRKFNKIR